jgi:hypothetical protein
MTFKIAVITALLSLSAMAQTAVPVAVAEPTPTASITLPTYIGAGVAFNQIGTPRTNLWATAIYPAASSVGLYSSTTTDIIPVQKLDAATGNKYYAFTTSIRQGLHKALYSSNKFTFLLGGDAGLGFSQAAPSGVNVGLSAAFTGTGIYQFKPRWAVILPVRGLYAGGAWNLIPEIGIVFKP